MDVNNAQVQILNKSILQMFYDEGNTHNTHNAQDYKIFDLTLANLLFRGVLLHIIKSP